MQPLTALDPLAHRATMDALDAQRAAYRRYARTLDAQRSTLTDGDPEQAGAAVDDALRGLSELEAGAQRLPPTLEYAHGAASADQLRELQQRVGELMHAAHTAETAIQNLSTQLEAWRDAYGRQLAELGVTAGGGTDASGEAGKRGGGGASYGAPGFGRDAASASPRILDRHG